MEAPAVTLQTGKGREWDANGPSRNPIFFSHVLFRSLSLSSSLLALVPQVLYVYVRAYYTLLLRGERRLFLVSGSVWKYGRSDGASLPFPSLVPAINYRGNCESWSPILPSLRSTPNQRTTRKLQLFPRIFAPLRILRSARLGPILLSHSLCFPSPIPLSSRESVPIPSTLLEH